MADWLDDPVPAPVKTFTKYGGYGTKTTNGTTKSSSFVSTINSGTINIERSDEPLVKEDTFATSGNTNTNTKSLPLQSRNVNVSLAASAATKVTKDTMGLSTSKGKVYGTKTNPPTNVPSSSVTTTSTPTPDITVTSSITIPQTNGKRSTNKKPEAFATTTNIGTVETKVDKKVKGKTKPSKKNSQPLSEEVESQNESSNTNSKTTTGAVSSNVTTATITQQPIVSSLRNRIEFDDEVLTPTSSHNSTRSKTQSLKLAIESNASYLFPLFLFSGTGTNSLSLNKSLESGYGEKKRPLMKARIAQTIRAQTSASTTNTDTNKTTTGTLESPLVVDDASKAQSSPSVSGSNVSVPNKSSEEGKKNVGFTASSSFSGVSHDKTPPGNVSIKSSENDVDDDEEENETSFGFTYQKREETSVAMRDAFRRVSMAPDILHERLSILPCNNGRPSLGRLSISMGRLSIAPNSLQNNRPSSIGMSRMSILQPRASIMPNQGFAHVPMRSSSIGRMSIAPLAYRARESIAPSITSLSDDKGIHVHSTRGNNRRTNVGFLSVKHILAEDDEEPDNDGTTYTTNGRSVQLSSPLSHSSESSTRTGSSVSLAGSTSYVQNRPSISASTSSSAVSSVSTVCRKFGPPSRVSIHSSTVSSGRSTVASPEPVNPPSVPLQKPRSSIYPYQSFGIMEEDDTDEGDTVPVEDKDTENDDYCMAPSTTNEVVPIDPVAEGFSVLLAGILEYLPSSDLLLNIPPVCSAWHAQAAHVYSWRIASNMTEQYGKPKKSSKRNNKHNDNRIRSSMIVVDPPLSTWQPFLRAFPWGSFLSDGAYKSVFRVWNAQLKRIEAISVMDIRAIAKTGNLPIIAAEIQAGCLLSHLIRTGVCPNFVQTYQVFVSAYSPMVHFSSLWGAPDSNGKIDNCNNSNVNNQICPFDNVNISSIGAAESIVKKYAIPTAKNKPKTTSSSDTFLSDPLLNRAQAIVNQFSKLFVKAPTTIVNGKNGSSSAYQFIRMELCRGGDIEGYLRRIEYIIERVESVQNSSQTVTLHRSNAKGNNTIHSNSVTDAGRLYLSKLDLIAALNARSMAFQMIYSLFTARERLYFRHYDIKLLNFFAKPATDEVIETESTPSLMTTTPDQVLNKLSSSVHTVRLRYGLGTDLYDIPLKTFANTYQENLPEEETWINSVNMPDHEKQVFKQYSDLFRAGYIIKLADYGTADTVPVTINTPVKSFHFTTLENLPPEYFISGDQAVAGYPTDTWALGLCLLHLLWGACPYEEVMVNVSCPPVLRKLLLRLWKNEDTNSINGSNNNGPSYSVLTSVIDNDDDCGKVFADTLYRYCVLLWSNSSLFVNTVSYSLESNRVWKLLCAVCSDSQGTEQIIADLTAHVSVIRSGVIETKGKTKKGDTKKATTVVASSGFCTVKELQALRKTFDQDKQTYSLYSGTHPLIQRARRRAERIPGFMDLSVRMLAWSPEYRITMRDSLLHSSFVPFRKLDTFGDDDDDNNNNNGSNDGNKDTKENGVLTLPFVYYSRDEEAEEVLPLL